MPTNPKKPGKWPGYASECKDEAKFLAAEITKVARDAQLAILGGQVDRAIVFCADIRDCANKIVWQMVQAECGIYEESAAGQDANERRRQRMA